MWNPDLSNKEQSVNHLWAYYEEVASLIDERLQATLKSLRDNTGSPDEQFLFRTGPEVQRHFDVIKMELGYSVCLALVVSFEASLYVDLTKRTQKASKRGVSKDLKSLCDASSRHPRLDDVIGTWKMYCCSIELAQFHDAYDFRNWLAHGRYWTPKLARHHFEPRLVRMFIDNLRRCMENHTSMYW